MILPWPTKKLGDILRTGSGGTPLKSRKEFYDGGTIPWLLSGEVAQGEITEAKNFITQAAVENSAAKMFPPNTVLVAMYGATAGEVGILRFPSTTNQAVCGILPSDQFLPEFLFYFLLSHKKELVAQAAGNAQPNISQVKIRNIDLPLTPLAEQKRIVGILDEAFEGIDKAFANTEKNLANALAILDDARELIFTKAGNSWTATTFGELCYIKHGFAFDGANFASSGDYVLLTPGNFFEEGGYRDRGEKQKYYVGDVPPDYILSEGDLLVAMTEQAAGLLGSPILVPESDRFLHNQRLGLVQIKPGVACANGFLFHLFNARFVRRAIHASASGVKVRHTSPAKIGQVTIKLPPTVAEQDRIVSQLDALAEESTGLTGKFKAKLELLLALKQSILSMAFGGRLSSRPKVSEAAE